ncbi:DUF2642 domain-containing protein [Oceanobacillus chungangensis]|uniref:DUF2642 domain-containing protein n=1 Tax=Oceanobacillus chungangensis TaxID=1229152 RepID=A0A3D8PJV3_9BACI|nr:DUF2642 domain-containing protein [Oceanobacillus chungangensis]RDW15509.1 DUF2642 domain-containing protein [Oceanobacillus chungangensis]
MDILNKYLQQVIEIEISGKRPHIGILLEIGSDVLVIYNGIDYIYISNMHIQKVKQNVDEEITMDDGENAHIHDQISLRKVLTNAKGMFSEIFVTGQQSIHGYITSILNDYFVFYSPVYKTMYIPFRHLKWLIPYHDHQTPYSLEKEMLPVNPSALSVSRTLDIQIEKLVGQIVVIDLAPTTDKIGQLKKIKGSYLELATARQDTVYVNIHHVQTIHFQ